MKGSCISRLGKIFGLGAVLLGALLPSSAILAKETPIQVSVSILPQKFFVEQIGGQKVEVVALVRPGQTPDMLDLSPKQVAHLGDSRVFFMVGVPFEDQWMPRIKETHLDLKVVPLYKEHRIAKRTGRQEGGHSHAENPHRWLNPRWVKSSADIILQTLVEEEPSSAAFFRRNHRKFVKQLVKLDRDIRALLKPVKNRAFLTYHPAWHHFADHYGLKEIPIEVEGREPGPRALGEVVQLGREHHVKVIFIQKQFSREIVGPVARSLGAKVVTVNPLAENYLNNMRQVAEAFVEAMQE